MFENIKIVLYKVIICNIYQRCNTIQNARLTFNEEHPLVCNFYKFILVTLGTIHKVCHTQGVGGVWVSATVNYMGVGLSW